MDEFDHRTLGVKLDLYHIQDDAPGMVFWHPRGYALYQVIETYIRGRMQALGYAEINTPALLPRTLWQASGHWDKFGAAMFAFADESGRELALKPMSCPGHVQVFNTGLRSWRDLPLRYAEFGLCHRNEPSGAMHGLMRTRAFEQDDAHVFCRDDDVQSEVASFVGLLARVYAELGFPDFAVALATRPAERAGSDAMWDWSEQRLGEAARQSGIAYTIKPGEGAFYGPKLEFALRDRQGRAWQCGTIQLDCVLPGRLDARYVAPDGSHATPLMIHHAVLGSIGRFIGILLEHHGGLLPFWLSPDQVAVTALSGEQGVYAGEVAAALRRSGIRTTVLAPDETLGRRIVIARDQAIPVLAIIGRREASNRTVTLRERDGAQSTLSLDGAIQTLAPRRQ